ncbi:MAG: dihydrolipoyllysine-residue acetyltransferase [Nitrosomonadales bacterium]|nr:dihydrolipoyllysine-residue acetyltransferase [Nitrosomonadales bacterium]
MLVPDIGNFKDVGIIEVMVKPGDSVRAEDALITLETDKATMDVPSPFAGVVKELRVKVGDKVSAGSLIALVETNGETMQATTLTPSPLTGEGGGGGERPKPTPSGESARHLTSPAKNAGQVIGYPARREGVASPGTHATPAPPLRATSHELSATRSTAHASPSIRRFARELGVDLSKVRGTAHKGRITREDVQNFVKVALVQTQPQPRGAGGLQIAEMPALDFAKFGEIESKPLSRIKKLSGAYLHRNWVNIPHVTQHDEADITGMETFRKQLNEEYAKQGIKITPLAFLLKAAVTALQQYPEFNASLDAGGENLVLKKYCHIGVAVDTPEGLVVPVLRDVNQKGIVQLAKELGEISARAREKKISAAEMQGGCFTISSLGGIGGSFFTPIINAPEVAILGISRSSMKPVWKDGKFEPRLMLPLSLSYDHRVIDGAAGARFIVYLSQTLGDARRLAL